MSSPWDGEPEVGPHHITPEPVASPRTGGRTWMLLAAVLAVVAAGVGALVVLTGGGSGDEYALSAAAREAADAPTAHFEVTLSSSSFDTVAFQGAVDTEAQLMTMSMDLGDMGLGELGSVGETSLEYIFDLADSVMYVSAGDDSDLFPVDAEWVSIDLEAVMELAGGSLADLQDLQDLSATDPTGAAGLLVDDENAVEIGREEIDGESMMHYQTTIDLAEVWAASGQDEQGLDELATEMDLPESVVFDVWVTEDNTLRRMVYEMPIMGELMTYQFDLVGLGDPVVVELPAEDEIVDITEMLEF